MDLQYRHVEIALADVFDVRPKGMPAFRARLRHLRNIGLPRLPQPGSGRKISYTRRQALEMLIALELLNVGQTPRNAALLAESMVRQSPYGQHEGEDSYAVFSEKKPGYITFVGLKAFNEMLQKPPTDVFLVLNISGCVRKLDPALDRAAARV